MEKRVEKIGDDPPHQETLAGGGDSSSSTGEDHLGQMVRTWLETMLSTLHPGHTSTTRVEVLQPGDLETLGGVEDKPASSPYPDPSDCSSPQGEDHLKQMVLESQEDSESVVISDSPAPRPQSPEPRPQSPEARPQSPEPRPQSPEARPQSPESRPQSPEDRPQRPEPRPQSLEARPHRPEARPQSPEARPQSPEPRPQSPEARPQSPEPRPQSPEARPQRPEPGHQHQDRREGSSPFEAWLPPIPDRPPKKLLSRVMATIQVAMRSIRKHKVGVIVADAPLIDGEGDGKTEAEGDHPAPEAEGKGLRPTLNMWLNVRLKGRLTRVAALFRCGSNVL
ncbi:unnamed protein product [Gadus morhua 'NCC']